MRSLEGSLHLGLALSLAVLIGGAWWLGHLALHRTADAFVLSRLQHDADALLDGVLHNGDPAHGDAGPILSPRTSALAIYDRAASGHYYVIRDSAGRELRSGSLGDRGLVLPELAPGVTRSWRTQGPAGQQLLVWGGTFIRKGRSLTLATAEDITPLNEAVDGFEHDFAAIALAGLVLAILVQRLVVRRAFRRLDPVYGEIERLERGALGQLSESVPKELWPLVRKLNRLLRSYAQRLERSRHAAGNLAHTLKGPLTVLGQQLEREGPTLPPALFRSLRDGLSDIARRMDRELRRARLAGDLGPGARFDPAADLPPLTDLLRHIYRDKGLEIEALVPAGTFPADREDLLELLGVLTDNACKWAGTRVRLELSLGPTGLDLTVEDDGPGCPESELAALTGRGTRVDEGVSGHGLGLSIAQEIVALYGGTLELGRSSALGGFRARVDLPNPVGPSG
jgi:signal transduction histidine kinase